MFVFLPRLVGNSQPAQTMTTREIVYTDKVNPPMHVFSQATKAGNIVYTSGNTGNTLDGKLKAGTCADRTVSFDLHTDLQGLADIVVKTQALDNLDLILKSAGSGLEHALKVTVFVCCPLFTL